MLYRIILTTCFVGAAYLSLRPKFLLFDPVFNRIPSPSENNGRIQPVKVKFYCLGLPSH